MKERLFDKFILCVLLILMVITGGYTNSFISETVVIFDMLIAIIILVLEELFRKNTVAVIAAVFSVVILLFSGSFYMIVVLSLYGLFSSDTISDVVSHIVKYYSLYNKKVIEAKVEEVEGFSVKELMSLLINSIIAAILICQVGSSYFAVVISLISIMMALRTDWQIYISRYILEKFDKSRETIYNMRKKNEETIQHADENIYMATLEERNRIAREIHDNVGHMLTRAIVQMQAIKVVNKDDNTRPLLESVDETINQAMLNIRKSVHELHDDSIDISIMTNELLKAVPERFNVTCKTSIESAMPSELKNTILAILRESITNIVKYSNGNEIKVEIIEHTAFWRLLIFDNGENEKKEYDALFGNTGEESGIGLINIYNRVKKHGGRTNIFSDKNGFSILITLPKGMN